MPARAIAAQPVRGALWLRDFELGLTSLLVRKTGARVPYSKSVLEDTAAWFRFFFAIHAAQPEPGAPFTVAFYPDRARPWYLIWPVLRMAGAQLTSDAASADVLFHFEDATLSDTAAPAGRPGARTVNAAAADISKSRVAAASQAAFGHALAVDPRAHHGPMVEKSELNGAHDGRIVEGPCEPAPGRVYQRLIDNRASNDALVQDLRCVIVGGRPAVTFIKRRPVGQRFANANTEVELIAPDSAFSARELEQIAAFARELRLDWGGLDVLRDRNDGKLYIVDANKTDMGPPTALPLRQKMQAVRILARRFREWMQDAAQV
ncbi:MAG: hypothetical protein GC189_04710 [Alphaproteobacteria bacterium]|nr:hypothetical protein [Alphaproteobacteria bacterium]